MEEFIAQARLLLGALGYDIFEPAKAQSSPQPQQPAMQQIQLSNPPVFKFAGTNFDATMRIDQGSGQFVVVTGSKARKTKPKGSE